MTDHNISKRSNFLNNLFIGEKNIIMDKDTPDHPLVEYYSSQANDHPYLVLSFTTDGDLISPSENNLHRFLGYSPQENLTEQEMMSNESSITIFTAFENTLKGYSERHVIALINKEGKTIHTAITFLPKKNDRNDVHGVYLIIEDYTEFLTLTEQLEVKEKHLNVTQQIADVGSWEYIIDEDRLSCSNHYDKIFGYSSLDDSSLGKPFEFVHPDDYKDTYEAVYESINTGLSYTAEFRIYHGQTKKLRYLKVEAEAVFKGDKPYKLVGIIKDHTEKEYLENNLITSNNNLKYIANNLNAGIWVKGAKTGKVFYLSEGVEEIFQVPLENIYDDPSIWGNMIHPEDKSEVSERQQMLVKGDSIKHKYRIVTEDGTTKWLYDQTVPWFNMEGDLENFFGVVVDITPEMEMKEKLNYNVFHDLLTSLPNQRSLYEKLDTLCNNKTTHFSILYLDLDRFNVINDSLGYQVGDEVLKNIAKKIESILPEDGYAARISSNDFIVIVKNYSDKEAILRLAEKITKHVEKPIVVMSYQLYITTSIGISFFPEDGDNKLTLLENAHSALYRAKSQGKNNIKLYSFKEGISSYKKIALENDMRKALKNEEFELYYQPQVDPHNSLVQSAEALIRWNHKEWGLVSPSEFISLAEDNHLIHQMTDWVIIKVCSQLKVWKINGYTLRPISINISPIRFFRKGLVQLVKQQLKLNRIPAKYLEFEITERSLLKREKNVLSTLAELRELGVKVAIDDFGTGFASLNYLREFELDIIKIDQVFIKNIDGSNKKDAAIVSSILHLAKGLNMKIVAEGVEEYGQLEFLKQNECDLIQGYLFSKPVPVKAFEQIMKTGNLKPIKQENNLPKEERRQSHRFEFPNCVRGKLKITEVNKRKVELSSSQILLKDVSLTGIKVVSTLMLPVNSAMKFKFLFTLMNEDFEIDGGIVWKNEGNGSTLYYGIKFDISETVKGKLEAVINKMSVLRDLNDDIPDTDFIKEDCDIYLRNRLM